MSKRISFKDIDVSEDGWLRCTVIRDAPDEFWIELPYSFIPPPDLIAASYAALCGTVFDEIEIDLPIGDSLATIIEQETKAKLLHQRGTDRRRRLGASSALNFSGGFDSLAAQILTPDAHLISLDFGGRFARERKFFERFNPFIFRTNLVDLKLNSYGWKFMGIGTTLLIDELKPRSYSFGSIQAGSLPRLLDRPLNQRSAGLASTNYTGVVLENPVAGISEIGAIDLVVKRHPELLIEILQSVALPNEDKFQRKHQMLRSLTTDGELHLPFEPQPTKSPKWGDSFARDLSSLAVIDKLDLDQVSATYEQGIPEFVTSNLDKVDLSFMTRFNPHAYGGVEPKILAQWYSTLTENGIFPYERQDWIDAANVVKLLRGGL